MEKSTGNMDMYFKKISKIEIAIKMIKLLEPKIGYHLAFSGGKDSIALIELAKMAEVQFEAVNVVTGIEPPDLMRFIKKYYPDVKRVPPKKTMWQLIPEKMIPPTRKARYCCEYLKEHVGEGKVVMAGIRAEENPSRAERGMIYFHTRYNKIMFNPIIDWTEYDVWEFIDENKFPYCELYDQGFTRLGCVGCPMAGTKTQLKEFALYPTIMKRYLKAFDEMLNVLWKKGKKTSWNNTGDVMDWWLKSQKWRKILNKEKI